MAMSPFIRRLRDLIGNELLVLPSVAVLPRDDRGRVLLVKLIDSGLWATIGGAVEPDESPQEAALREAHEEAGVELKLGPILAVLGGREYRMTYPNGDQTSYVVTVYDAAIVGGTPTADGDETSAVQWWAPSDLPVNQMSTLTRALLRDVGISPSELEPLVPASWARFFRWLRKPVRRCASTRRMPCSAVCGFWLERGLWRGCSRGCCTTSMARYCDAVLVVTPSRPLLPDCPSLSSQPWAPAPANGGACLSLECRMEIVSCSLRRTTASSTIRPGTTTSKPIRGAALPSAVSVTRWRPTRLRVRNASGCGSWTCRCTRHVTTTRSERETVASR